MSIAQMDKLRVTQILWTSNSDDRITRIAFRFSNGSLSPPLGFYKKNFKETIDVPSDVKHLEFRMTLENAQTFLHSIKMESKGN